MADLIAAMASSHAYTFLTPDEWEWRREQTREHFARRYGTVPPPNERLEKESLESDRVRFGKIRNGLERLRSELQRLAPDVLVVIGDDQGENYKETVPQLAIYTGDHVVCVDRQGISQEFACDPTLAMSIVTGLVGQGFDVTWTKSFPDDRLISHAHAEVLRFLAPSMPVVLVFMNAIHLPAPEPFRCYDFGLALRQSLQMTEANERVVAYASGGLSHFSAGYPYAAYGGPLTLGSICEEFDNVVIDHIRNGRGKELASLSSRDLLENGEIELRQWIALLGALGATKPSWLEYGAFYRGIMGMAVGFWSIE